MRKATVLLLGLIFLSSANTAHAAANIDLDPKNFFLQTSPGKTTREVVTLKNLDSSPKSVSLTWQGYRLTGSEFTSDVDRDNHSINFARLSTEKLELQPQGMATVEIEFAVPKDIQPADYYGSLIATYENSQTQASFTVRVLGRIEERVEIAQFSTKGDTIILKIANRGNQTTDFRANVKIQDLFGGAKDLEQIQGSLKAAEIKTIQVGHNAILPGPYQAKVDLEFGSQKQEVVFYSFWSHPEIFLIAGAISAIAVLIFLAKRRRRK